MNTFEITITQKFEKVLWNIFTSLRACKIARSGGKIYKLATLAAGEKKATAATAAEDDNTNNNNKTTAAAAENLVRTFARWRCLANAAAAAAVAAATVLGLGPPLQSHSRSQRRICWCSRIKRIRAGVALSLGF